jgi:hypothetical protein
MEVRRRRHVPTIFGKRLGFAGHEGHLGDVQPKKLEVASEDESNAFAAAGSA